MPSAPSEFELIEKLFRPATLGHKGALELKDDAAILDCPKGHELVVTADAIVAGVHFLANDPASLIARKLVRVNLSDLAAKGAKPAGMILSACFPAKVHRYWIEEFAEGLLADAREFGVPVLGGDTVATPGPATFSLTALGFARKGKMLRRSAARAGDYIWVSGTLGDGAFGLEVAKKRKGVKKLRPRHAVYLLDRYHLPQPRLALGQALVGLAHASMDVSDGLVGDLEHICSASGVGATISTPLVPLSPAVEAAIEAGIGSGPNLALTGGDDYELLFTAPPKSSRKIAALSDRFGLRLSPIGRIIVGKGVKVEDSKGNPIHLIGRGYRHFET